MQIPPSDHHGRSLRHLLRWLPILALAAYGLWIGLGATREGPRGAAAAPDGRWEAVERRLSLMGSWLRISLEAPTRAEALAVSERIVRELEAAEARLSTWRPDSELARLNAAPVGELVRVSPLLRRELERARDWSVETDGAFDPALAPLVAAWSLRSGGAQPTADALAAAREACGIERWSIESEGVRRLHRHAGFEEGAFGKGAGLDAALAAVESMTWRALSIDLGGQLLEARHSGALRRLVADPNRRDAAALAIEVPNGSLATSGDSERGLVVDGEPRSHILDPRTGSPSPRRGSVTVWASTAFDADCLSTACYVLGPDAAFALAQARADVELLWLQHGPNGLEARISQGLAQHVEALVPSLVIEAHVSTHRGDSPLSSDRKPQASR